ncbi:MAG: hypothetical protein OEN50_16010 [Deltaproteobacteria bacterium]|nr:hypothetical protein [Deltaproteobacteria bacterium]
MPYTLAINVGTATNAAQDAKGLVISLSCIVINDKFTEIAVVSISRKLRNSFTLRASGDPVKRSEKPGHRTPNSALAGSTVKFSDSQVELGIPECRSGIHAAR